MGGKTCRMRNCWASITGIAAVCATAAWVNAREPPSASAEGAPHRATTTQPPYLALCAFYNARGVVRDQRTHSTVPERSASRGNWCTPCAENVSSCGSTTQLGTPNAPVLVKETHHRTPQRTRNGKRAVPCPVPRLRCGVCKVVTFVARRITAAAIIESSKPLFSDLAWRRRFAPFVPILLVA